MDLSKYVIKFEKEKDVYLFNTKNNLSVKIEKKLLEIIKRDQNIRLEFQNFLSQNNFYCTPDEFQNAVAELQERESKTLRIIILAHGDCNFRCKYCYEKFNNRCISDKTSNILDFIVDCLNKGDFENLQVSWFGGEPLLGYKDILEISKELILYCKDNHIRYFSDITTNGYLLSPTIFSKLVNQCKITTYQITVDGTKTGHDNQRVLKNGSGSYDRIIKNIKSTIDTNFDFQVIIRMNISKENYNSILDFLKNDACIFKKDHRYKVLFRNVGDWGCGERSEDYSVKRFEKDLSFEFPKIALNNGYSLFDPFIIPTNNLACYAQKKNSYVIDTEGNLLKCTVMLYDECNKIGNLQERKINTIRENLWLNNFESLSGKCYQCPLILICKGGFCPKLKVFKSRTHNICLEMQQMIMNNFELRILSDDFDYTLKGRDDG